MIELDSSDSETEYFGGGKSSGDVAYFNSNAKVSRVPLATHFGPPVEAGSPSPRIEEATQEKDSGFIEQASVTTESTTADEGDQVEDNNNKSAPLLDAPSSRTFALASSNSARPVAIPEDVNDLPDDDALVPWEATSLHEGLGWDPVEGTPTGLSLIRLSAFLTNAQLHLLIMHKELLHVENTVRRTRAEGRAAALGFQDPRNLGHVTALLASLSEQCSALKEATSRISHTFTRSRSDDDDDDIKRDRGLVRYALPVVAFSLVAALGYHVVRL